MSKPHGTKDFWLAGLRAESSAFRAAVSQPGALDLAVPTCPEWTVLDLVHHLGGVYVFVLSHVTRGVTTPPDRRRDAIEADLRASGELPTGAAAVTWWEDKLATLLRTLEALDPDIPAWNWAPQAKKVGFWHRRMAHETAVHRWDAQMAVGLTDPIETKLAADGISEVLDTWLPAGKRRGPRDRTGIVALRATDIEQEWHVRLRGEGIALLDTNTLFDDDAHQHERAIAAGTASDLLLALYGRVSFEVLDLAGDARLVEALRTG
jgi:uncharacterized protein (TIGR03083 family)